MDTRDQTLTKLTRLHDKSHPTQHHPTSLRWNYSRTEVSIMKLVMEEGWWWWWRQIPLSGARTDSRWALLREFRAWRRLCIIKRDESFSLIFFSPKVNIWSQGWRRWSIRGPTRQGARPGGRARPRPHGQGVGPLMWIFLLVFLYIPKIISVDFQVILRTFISAQK